MKRKKKKSKERKPKKEMLGLCNKISTYNDIEIKIVSPNILINCMVEPILITLIIEGYQDCLKNCLGL